MRNIDADLVCEAENFVTDLFSRNLSEKYLFHSIDHTLFVVKSAAAIGQNSGLTEQELNILKVSALFHDVGYITTDSNHEEVGSAVAGTFLETRLVDPEEVSQVQRAILATKVPQHPTDRISDILCDADLMHLAGPDYFQQMVLLRMEWKRTGRYDFTEYQFHENSVDFFRRHHYHSEYGRAVLEPRKEETLKKIRERMNALKNQS